MTQEQIQEKYLHFQLIQQQIKQIQQQILLLEQQTLDLKQLDESLTNLSKVKTNTPLYSPLGMGIFLETEIKNNKEVLMNVGSKVVLKKPISETQEIIRRQIDELEEAFRNLQGQLSESIEMATNLSGEIETLNSTIKKK